jgi:alpha-N-acetylglucosamine transferase
MQSMDELFLLPPAPVGMPRAYWLKAEDGVLSSQVVLIQPNKDEFAKIQDAIRNRQAREFDMEILNNLYKDTALIIPHRPYNLLTGEFRSHNHTNYLGNDTEDWDVEKILAETKFIHFSDWPVPKPWYGHSIDFQEKMPDCIIEKSGHKDCKLRDVWIGIYDNFASKRKVSTRDSNS